MTLTRPRTISMALAAGVGVVARASAGQQTVAPRAVRYAAAMLGRLDLVKGQLEAYPASLKGISAGCDGHSLVF